MKIDNKKLLVLIIINSIIFGLIGGIFGLVNMFVTLFFYSILFYSIKGLYAKLKDKNYKFYSKENFYEFFTYFFQRALSLILLIVVILGGFSIYNNEINPAKMPIYSLTNGEKEVVFIGMSHIGTQDFYKNVEEKITELKTNDYTLYFEGVKPGSEENNTKFNQALGFQFDENTYKDLAKLYGLVNQNNEQFLGLVNNNDKNVDVSIDDIIKIYETKQSTGTTNQSQKQLINISYSVEETLQKLSDRQLQIFRYINKSIINLIVKNENIQNNIQTNFANKNLFDVILHNRNEVLANEIVKSSDQKIVITYGLLHFNGVLDLLKKDNLKWRIKEINYLYPLK